MLEKFNKLFFDIKTQLIYEDADEITGFESSDDIMKALEELIKDGSIQISNLTGNDELNRKLQSTDPDILSTASNEIKKKAVTEKNDLMSQFANHLNEFIKTNE